MSQERVSTADVQGLIIRQPVADVALDRTAAEAERPALGLSTEMKQRLLSIFSPMLLLILWEVLVQLGLLDKRFFPAPSSIVGTFWNLIVTGELFRHLQASISRIIVGFLLGFIPGLILGITMGLFRWVRAFLMPMVASLYPIPKIAILPLVMLIFGLGEASKWVIIAIGVFFLILYNTMAGVMNIPNIYLDVGKNFGASRLQFYRTVALPGAMPLIFTGIKLAAGVALLIIVAAEFVGAKTGIGYMIWQSWQTFSVETMYVGLVVISILGYLVSLLLDELERILIPWHL
ncbi:MAG TPA: ABC transporter permease [Chloroflexota bacterium]|jgi:NitT/TauT family transport system permease protein|nr:ABC transporter permease [Chloroflexota bacterium]